MSEMKKLGNQLHHALTLGIPAELVAMIATTNHPGRLQNLFQESGAQLLAAHREFIEREVQKRPSVGARLTRDRLKALVDLVRARSQALGERKPPVKAMLKLMDAASLPENVVKIRKAA